MPSKQEEQRITILLAHRENPSYSHAKLAKSLKVAKSTVTNVIKVFGERLSTARKSGSGGNRKPKAAETTKRVAGSFKRNPNLSLRDAANKLGVSSTTVHRAKKRAGLSTYKKVVTPNRDDKQNTTAKARSRRLYTTMLTKFDCVVMDDETYVKADYKQLPGQEFYTAKGRGKVADIFKHMKLSKFAKKYLVWQAICTCGLKSSIFIASGTVNQEIYVKECLNKRLLPFLKKHGCSVLFWPDLASCHYGKKAMEWYAANNVQVVPKDKNPPNTPELRPIEKYWAIVKRNLKKTKKTAKDEQQFKANWLSAAKKVDKVAVQNLMTGVKRKARQFGFGKAEA